MKILMITTGGTLACKETSDGLMPLLKGEDILNFAKDKSDIEVLDFRLIDSSIMTDDDRSDLANLIYLKKDDYDSFIITHGTDSLAYTASYLDCALKDFNKTIVLTAAQLPLLKKGTDAIDNLNLAIKAAKEGYYNVCCAINNKLFPAKTITKISTNDLICFESANKKYLTAPLKKSNGDAKLLLMNNKKIDVVYITPILKKEEILKKDFYTDIIVLALGSGGMLNSQLEAFQILASKGINIHLKSQCLYGYIENVYEAHKASKQFNILNDISLEHAIYSLKFYDN